MGASKEWPANLHRETLLRNMRIFAGIARTKRKAGDVEAARGALVIGRFYRAELRRRVANSHARKPGKGAPLLR